MSQPPPYPYQHYYPPAYARPPGQIATNGVDSQRIGNHDQLPHPDHTVRQYGPRPVVQTGQIQHHYPDMSNHNMYGSTYYTMQSGQPWQASQHYVRPAMPQQTHPAPHQQHWQVSPAQDYAQQSFSTMMPHQQPHYINTAVYRNVQQPAHFAQGTPSTLQSIPKFDGTTDARTEVHGRDFRNEVQQPRAHHPSGLVERSPNTALEMAHPPKRQKSNEGIVVPVSKQASTAPKKVSLSRVSLGSSSEPTVQGSELYEVLHALADEYIHAARSVSIAGAEDVQYYQRLISAAISSLQSAVQMRQVDVRKLSRTRLQLAKLLHDETEDFEELEKVLAKGIAACDKLYDIKFALQHMSICNLHTRNVKAASKMLDKTIAEAESLSLRHWQYAFHALKITQCLQLGSIQDLHAAMKHIHLLQELASKHKATSMKIFASCLEAVTAFALGQGNDLETAQRAVAEARSYQLGSDMKAMPQIEAMLNCLQMLSQVPKFSSDAMYAGVRQIYSAQNTLSKASQWSKDGCLAVPLGLGKPIEHILEDSGGTFVEAAGQLALNVKWITSAEMMTICYAMCGIASLPKNGEKHEAEKFLQEALKINKTSGRTKSASDIARKRQMNSGISYLMACALAARGCYTEAQKIITEVDEHRSEARFRLLSGVCEQGLGDLKAALRLYAVDLAQLQAQPDANFLPLQRDVQILAGLNSIHIMHQLKLSGVDELLELLELHCNEHVNSNFTSAYNFLVTSINSPTATIMATKNSLSAALQPAKLAGNQQLLALIMSMLTELFFTDIIGEQAAKSAKASYALAVKSGDPLWKAVSAGMYRSTLELSAQAGNSEEANELAGKAVSELPPAVAKALQLR